MLTTSYAWYAFENGSTTFEVVTNNDNIIVSFQRGEYINTSVAVPIASDDVAQYSEKNNFTVRVKDNPASNEMLLTVSLVDISISGALQNPNFKVDLYYQNKSIASIAGDTIGTSGTTTKTLGSVVLDDDIDNNFEVRVYILDNGEDQSALMNKTFQAKIKVEAISRLKTSMSDYANADINVSSITIDGETSATLPTSGYYTMSSTCTKGSTLTWEPFTKTITYGSGSKVGDSCSLTFTSATSTKLLSSVEPGSYVKYTGTNGCDGKHCEGQNANYVSDNDMGYCGSSYYKFRRNGWRVAYVKDGSAYLVSAGSPECVRTYIDSKSTGVGVQTLSTDYYYGSGYKFDTSTGTFSLVGVTSSALNWSSNYSTIIADTPYTCKKSYIAGTCAILYEITEYYSSTEGKAYEHRQYDAIYGAPNHLANLENKALTYCNEDYVYGGVCDENSTWVMNATDFKYITGSTLSFNSCYDNSYYGSVHCGYNNDLIDIGGNYWYATPEGASSFMVFTWTINRRVGIGFSSNLLGVRPVIRLKSSVLVIGGAGTYEDPYQIANS